MVACDGVIAESGTDELNDKFSASVIDRRIHFLGGDGRIFQEEGGDGGSEDRFGTRHESEFDACICGDARGKFWGGGIIEGDDNSAAQKAAPEGSDPFRGVGTL